MSPNNKFSGVLKIVFLTLFLDMIGFSIIFPLFPALIKHYLNVDPDNFFLKSILDGISAFSNWGGASDQIGATTVLFGGVLAALYSFLQFVFSPFWGALSDRIGRKPVLIFSIAGTTLSYIMWIFSGSFTTLILARVLLGVMSGNISTASAVIGDVTDSQNRSKGMAVIGMAFGVGFIIGPALGGAFSKIDLTLSHPSWTLWGINPFSAPAFVAFVLALINLLSVCFNFNETLSAEKRGQVQTSHRSANPLKLFRPLPSRGVNIANMANFLYTLAFSGMEFTLTFLAVERFAYSSMDNAYMFVFIGILIAVMQGGVVRRHAHRIGEKQMTILGLLLLIPGLILISIAWSAVILYAGLGLLACGSAMVIACLTALVSLYTPETLQGQSIGVFRSLGALGRVLGPSLSCLLYWRFGSAIPYFASAIFMVLPILLVLMLEKPKRNLETP